MTTPYVPMYPDKCGHWGCYDEHGHTDGCVVDDCDDHGFSDDDDDFRSDDDCPEGE